MSRRTLGTSMFSIVVEITGDLSSGILKWQHRHRQTDRRRSLRPSPHRSMALRLFSFAIGSMFHARGLRCAIPSIYRSLLRISCYACSQGRHELKAEDPPSRTVGPTISLKLSLLQIVLMHQQRYWLYISRTSLEQAVPSVDASLIRSWTWCISCCHSIRI